MEKDNIVKVKKNIVVVQVADNTGCGHIRQILPMVYVNAVFGGSQISPIISSMFIKQTDILVKTRTIIFQRQMSELQLSYVKEYKRLQKDLKYKMIYDIDDLIWEDKTSDGIPSHNKSKIIVTKQMQNTSIEIMKLCDLVTVSTEYIKSYLKTVIDTPIQVVDNTIPKYLYGDKINGTIQSDIKKPKILYNGAPQHYNNKEKLKGDLDGIWSEWIIESIQNDTIDFYCMGGVPFFLEDLKDKFTSMEWITMLDYPNKLKEINADFIISPLKDCHFNNAKSDIKYLESSAIGSLHIGTVFSSGSISPYDNNILKISDNAKKEDIDIMIKKYSKKDIYNKTIKDQFDYINDNSRYTESAKYINKLCTMI